MKPLSPMLATAADAPPRGDGWVYEPKLDGYRLLAHLLRAKEGVEARLFTRSGREVTVELRPVAESLERIARKLAALPVVLDGEVVVQLGTEAPQFQAMQRYRDMRAGTLRYYVFDLLRVGTADLAGRPLSVRRARLERLLRDQTRPPKSVVRLVPRLRGTGPAALRAALAAGYEGVLAKRVESTYRAGQRSAAWLKLKRVETEDLVVGGYTRGGGVRSRTFGALLVGNRTPAGLAYAGHVGTGFDERALTDLRRRLTPLEAKVCPFTRRPPLNDPAVWVKPELVVEVRYVQRTQDGVLRLPVFVRVRDDKAAEETEAPPAVTRIGGRSTAREARRRQPVPLHTSREARDVLRQLDQLDGEGTLEIGGVALRVTNLDKGLWPAPPSKRMRKGSTAALTKRDLLRYLALVSPSLLAHLRRRPVTMTRYPNGVGKTGFYQRHWDGAVPPYVKVVRLASEDAGEEREFLLLESLAALLHAGQLAALELHPWYLRVESEHPDFVVFDLDSYLYSGEERAGEEPAPHAKGFEAARKAAWLVKGELEALELPSFVKTSGKTGLHIFVPIRRRLGFEETHAIARTIAERLERKHPKLLTTAWSVPLRRGKVFLDYNMNARSKTLAAAYSPRAAAGAPVSVPIEWEELDEVIPQELTIHTVPALLAERGDPWEGILAAPVDLAARLRAA